MLGCVWLCLQAQEGNIHFTELAERVEYGNYDNNNIIGIIIIVVTINMIIIIISSSSSTMFFLISTLLWIRGLVESQQII